MYAVQSADVPEPDHTPARPVATRRVADVLQPLVDALFSGPPPVTMALWDGSRIEGRDPTVVVEVRSPDVIRRVLWAPGELGLARSFVVGDLDTDAPLAPTLRALQAADLGDRRAARRALAAAVRAASELGAIGRPPPAPPEEIVARGRRHSRRRDATTVSHHYDVGNDFYRLVLGDSLTYSCARFSSDEMTLGEAQAAKHELVCRKLGLDSSRSHGARPRLLDIGCGWGSMAMHAAELHDVSAVGVTISDEQLQLARARVDAAGLAARVTIRLQDYRAVDDGPYDAVASIGMAEHVGRRNLHRYFANAYALLRPGGRMLNHAIASVRGSRMTRSSFVGRYVFPDGELVDIADTVAAMEDAGFEVRDVENLREHYERTIRCWVDRLEERWDDAVALVGTRRARVWRLYLSGSINGFEDGGLQLYQTLGVKTDGWASHMPPTRAGWG